MDNNYCVYVHIAPDGRKYYGMTSQEPKNRWRKDGRGYKEYQPDFYNDIIKYGWDNIEHIIVAKGLSKDEAEWLEEELIKTNKTYDSKYGYNKYIGKNRTDETKTKMSEAHRGKCKPTGSDSSNHKSVICLTTNRIFDTLKDGANYYGIHRCNISSCCRGKLKSTGKLNGIPLVWRYIDIIEL